MKQVALLLKTQTGPDCGRLVGLGSFELDPKEPIVIGNVGANL